MQQILAEELKNIKVVLNLAQASIAEALVSFRRTRVTRPQFDKRANATAGTETTTTAGTWTGQDSTLLPYCPAACCPNFQRTIWACFWKSAEPGKK